MFSPTGRPYRGKERISHWGNLTTPAGRYPVVWFQPLCGTRRCIVWYPPEAVCVSRTAAELSMCFGSGIGFRAVSEAVSPPRRQRGQEIDRPAHVARHTGLRTFFQLPRQKGAVAHRLLGGTERMLHRPLAAIQQPGPRSQTCCGHALQDGFVLVARCDDACRPCRAAADGSLDKPSG